MDQQQEGRRSTEMNLIAVVILAPVLAWTVHSRRFVLIALAAVWAATLAPTAHYVLREDAPNGSLLDTLSFFALSYLGLAVAAGIAWLVHGQRARQRKARPLGSSTA
jgi:hypothetical protein